VAESRLGTMEGLSPQENEQEPMLGGGTPSRFRRSVLVAAATAATMLLVAAVLVSMSYYDSPWRFQTQARVDLVGYKVQECKMFGNSSLCLKGVDATLKNKHVRTVVHHGMTKKACRKMCIEDSKCWSFLSHGKLCELFPVPCGALPCMEEVTEDLKNQVRLSMNKSGGLELVGLGGIICDNSIDINDILAPCGGIFPPCPGGGSCDTACALDGSSCFWGQCGGVHTSGQLCAACGYECNGEPDTCSWNCNIFTGATCVWKATCCQIGKYCDVPGECCEDDETCLGEGNCCQEDKVCDGLCCGEDVCNAVAIPPAQTLNATRRAQAGEMEMRCFKLGTFDPMRSAFDYYATPTSPNAAYCYSAMSGEEYRGLVQPTPPGSRIFPICNCNLGVPNSCSCSFGANAPFECLVVPGMVQFLRNVPPGFSSNGLNCYMSCNSVGPDVECWTFHCCPTLTAPSRTQPYVCNRL